VAVAALEDVVRIAVKLYAVEPASVEPSRFVGVFHGWIQRGEVPGLLIDVADYSHVHEGPGVMLIGHEADHAIDLGEGRPGIAYSRKREPEGTLEDRVRAAIEAVELAADEIEADPGAGDVRFDRDELLVRVNDRLAAPSDEATFEALLPVVAAALAELHPGRPASVERVADPGGPLTLRVRLA
jgi:hypothetical protein